MRTFNAIVERAQNRDALLEAFDTQSVRCRDKKAFGPSKVHQGDYRALDIDGDCLALKYETLMGIRWIAIFHPSAPATKPLIVLLIHYSEG